MGRPKVSRKDEIGNEEGEDDDVDGRPLEDILVITSGGEGNNCMPLNF